jgi:beta-glucosidase
MLAGDIELIRTSPSTMQLVRRAAADAIVLLKNDASILPLSSAKKPIKTIAVLGDNSKAACISGGGSAALRPSWTVSPLEAITAAAKAEFGAEVSWAVGAPGHSYQPSIDPFIADGRIAFYNETWEGKQDVKEIHSTESATAFNMFLDNIPEHVPMTCWIHWSASFTPDQDGEWRFGFVVAGQGNIYIDGKEIVNNSQDQEIGELFFGLGSTEKVHLLHLAHVSAEVLRLTILPPSFPPLV